LEEREVEIRFGNLDWVLSSDKYMWNKNNGDVFISDCHFGKVTHFRKNAIPVPQASAMDDLVRLKSILERHKPKRLFFMGDLFHSHINSEWEFMLQVLANFDTEYILIQGNHDILDSNAYEGVFNLKKEYIYNGEVCLSHEPIKHEKPIICGHIHPGVRVKVSLSSKAKLPCFWMNDSQLIMPAFGSFTGCVEPEQSKTAHKWAVLNDLIFKV